MPLLLALLLAASTPAVDIGTSVADFTATTVDGHPLSLADVRQTHKAVAVVFLSTVCPYSNLHSDALRELAAEYASRGLEIVGVNSNSTEDAAETLEFVRRHRLAFPVVKDVGNRIADLLGARLTPEAFLMDSDGTLRYRGRVQSKLGATELKDAILAVLADRPVTRPVAKAFGCAITRESRRQE